MEDDAEMQTFSYENLRTEFNLTDKLIAQLDRKAQHILGNGIVMIDSALRDKESKPKERINRALVFINITKIGRAHV